MDIDEFIETVCETLKINRKLETYEEYDLEQIYDQIYKQGYDDSCDGCDDEYFDEEENDNFLN